MRTTPAQERAALHAEAVSLRDCATRLEALAEELPADETGPDWTGILVLLARRCRVTAEELEGAAALYREDRPAPAGATAPADEAPASVAANPRTAEIVLGYVARAVPIQTATRRMTGQRPTEGR